jgi:2-amino-4-hydroxy-6-hydroxymethyldihydropteridine diphosphokinase
MNTVYLLLGGNAGDRMQMLTIALQQLEQACGHITERSHIYETAAWGLEDQPSFLNMAVCVHSVLSPTDFLQAIQLIENDAGRQRDIKWGQRTLDIDILFYNQDVINTPDLVIPHPFLRERMFALAPLSEIAPQLMHPALHKTIEGLKNECTDTLPVKQIV